MTTNVAVDWPSATVTDAGTVATEVLLLDNATVAPPAAAAAVSVTVPLAVLPAAIVGVANVTFETATLPDGVAGESLLQSVLAVPISSGAIRVSTLARDELINECSPAQLSARDEPGSANTDEADGALIALQNAIPDPKGTEPMGTLPLVGEHKHPERDDDEYDDDEAPPTPTNEPKPVPVQDPPSDERPHPPLTV